MIKGPHTETTTRAGNNCKDPLKDPSGWNRPRKLLPIVTEPSRSFSSICSSGPPYGQKTLKACSVFAPWRSMCDYQNKKSAPDFRRRIKLLNNKLHVCISQGCQTNGQAVGYGGLVPTTTTAKLVGRGHARPWCNKQILFHSCPAEEG